MIIKQDIFLADFDFWQGARYTARQLTKEDFVTIGRQKISKKSGLYARLFLWLVLLNF